MNTSEPAVVAAFYVLSAITLGGAAGVVFGRNMFHAALFLVASFFGLAGIYVLLQADFLAAVQVLIYAGAVSILVVFAIMLTRQVERGNEWNQLRVPGLLLGLLLLIGLLAVFTQTQWAAGTGPYPTDTVQVLARQLFGPWVLPFEVASVLLLAALVGAIIIAREE
ncbi:MAG: NADH-quinone oxidoreductase subunit J [Chloroflexota bacterium]